MNSQQQGLITLMKSAITGEAYSLPEDFDLEEAQQLIKQHHMLPLAYTGACYCGVDRNSEVMQKMLTHYYRFLIKSEGQMRTIDRVFAAFDEHGIDYMPLKGCKLKKLYPAPELRSMGDADILIRMEQYPRIIPIMESLGFQAVKESDHELVWKAPELYLELHKRVIPSYNQDFFEYFGDGWKLATCKEGTRYSMAKEDEMIFLFTHFARHFRDGGIGCRYVLDLWVFRRANPGMDEEYISKELCKLQLDAFYENILSLIDVWFEGAAADEMSDAITEYIFASGSWGTTSSRAISHALRYRADATHTNSARSDYFWVRLFPGVDALKGKYPVLEKAPWMLPLVWIYRPVYKLFFEQRSLKFHASRMKVMDKAHIDEREQVLRYMGLAYNFGGVEED